MLARGPGRIIDASFALQPLLASATTPQRLARAAVGLPIIPPPFFPGKPRAKAASGAPNSSAAGATSDDYMNIDSDVEVTGSSTVNPEACKKATPSTYTTFPRLTLWMPTN